MLQLIDLFLEQNFEIIFVSSAQKTDYSFDLKSLGISSKNIELNNSSFDEFVADLNPDFVLFDRFISEEQFGWRVAEKCPNAIRILDTEDLHCLRYARQKALKNNIDFEIEDILLEETALREIASIYRCNLSLMVSDFEIEILQNIFKIDESLLFYLPMFYSFSFTIKSYSERKDFVFIGNFLHEPNYDAILQLKSIWKDIRVKLPGVNLKIYGAYSSQKVEQLHNPKEGFLIKGRADDAFEVLSNAKVLLAPLRFGAGIKGKLLEAMVVGTPSVTTSIGCEGISNKELWNGFVSDNLIDLAEKAVLLYEDENVWNKKMKFGIEILNSKFEKSVYVDSFAKFIKGSSENIIEKRKRNFIGALLFQNQYNSLKYMSKWIEEKNRK